jgi:hypothetical protein
MCRLCQAAARRAGLCGFRKTSQTTVPGRRAPVCHVPLFPNDLLLKYHLPFPAPGYIPREHWLRL